VPSTPIRRVTNPGRPYARAVRAGSWVHTAGFTGEDAEGHVPDDFAGQCELIFAKAIRALDETGASLADVVTVTVYVTDPGDYALLNEPFQTTFGEFAPARATVVVASLSSPAKRVEMQFVAYVGEGGR
jgi:2-iminobutanoate/2-iminopropanoate deaminase